MSRGVLIAIVAAVVIAAAAVTIHVRRPSLPTRGSPQYEDTSRAFYRGLAALEVGLLDDARREFTRATQIVPTEPASWANLGITQLRLGELDAAPMPISRALELAPNNSELALLAGRMEIARGRLPEGTTQLRRAVMLDSRSLRPRFALVEELDREGTDAADAEAQQQLDELLMLAPNNLAILLERSRMAAKRSDVERLRDSVVRLKSRVQAWPPIAAEQYRGLESATGAGNFQNAARSTTLLRNVLARVPEYGESLAAVRTPTELIAEPLDTFLALAPPEVTASPADTSLAFTLQQLDDRTGTSAVAAFFTGDDERPVLAGIEKTSIRRIGGTGSIASSTPAVSSAGVLPIDWNHDFRTDLVVAGQDGLRLLMQAANGSFVDQTGTANAQGRFRCGCFGAWAADVEMDGDIDIVVGLMDGGTVVLRNNGNGSWTPQQTFAAVNGARGFAWADVDGDADPDAIFIDSTRAIRIFLNRQAGAFVEVPASSELTSLAAVTVGDLDGDGIFEVITLDAGGSIRSSFIPDPGGVASRRGGAGPDWQSDVLASGPAVDTAVSGGSRLFVADLDNNGRLDLIASSRSGTRVWLGGDPIRFTPLSGMPAAEVFAVADVDGDGRLDLVGTDGGRPVMLTGRGSASYHWKTIRARAQQNAGDQRINSFGIGGEIAVRSGLLMQKQLLIGAPLHFGLGTRTAIDVARIVWPNGVPQAEFDAKVDDRIVAEQRLKGSCPWVFTNDGSQMTFVTDFLWRSPLGLRINAQDTVGVGQTEDWIRIRGDQLAAVNGMYDVRITAELWETHFFDHVALLAVDHPVGTDVFVDERFSATAAPRLAVQAVHARRPVVDAHDEGGHDVTDLVARDDGKYLATFARGTYQGIAQEHFVDFALGSAAPREGPLVLVARGWVYPTDSSINVAIGQNGDRDVQPRGIALEAQDRAGRWTIITPDLGFPAGKNKTILIDLSGARNARRLRLRTNLEVYWDSLSYALVSADAPLATKRIAATTADLQYRGFSQTVSPRGDSPETPLYDRLANTTQRWRDLAGYYTRFGDVKELIAAVDDRYVIMNAGDELRLAFPALDPPRAGWTRDFVLIGDGWEKDGDYNTDYSTTVTPLPTHATATYDAASESLELEDDPVYRAHAEDWVRYHTRYVTPREFLRGLRVR